MEANTLYLYHEEFATEKGRIVVWKSENDPTKKNSSPRKELERQEIIKMLHVLGYPVTSLHYKDSGQPMIAQDSSEYLSVSHADGWFALYIASAPVGIDIEVERAIISKGKNWFLNPAELPKHLTTQALHLVWGAKEAYYKKREGQIEDLCMDVTVETIDSTIAIIAHEGKEEQLFHKQIQDVYVVWT